MFPDDNGDAQIKHLIHILSAVILWIEPPGVIAASIRSGGIESEFMDGCHALISIASFTTSSLFYNLLKSIRHYSTINLLSGVTSEAVKGLWILHKLVLTGVYGLIVFMHHSRWRDRLPAKSAYYNYVCAMLLLNGISLFGCFLVASGAGFGLWLYNLTTVCYHSLYLPLLYVTFLADFFQIFGLALGFNLLFQYDDLITGIGFATVVPNLLPYGISHLGKKMARTVNACMAAFALL